MNDELIGTPSATGATPAYVPAGRVTTTDGVTSTSGVTSTDGALATDFATTEDASTKDVAKEQAASVATDAKQGAAEVAQTAKDETAKVVSEAGKQAKDLFHQTRSELTDQAANQQQRVAGGLRSLSQELSSMSTNSEQSGVASDLVRQGAERVDSIASWLEDREPGSLVDEVKSFARAKPGTFLAVCAGLGLVAGRLTRNLASDASGEQQEPSDAAAPGFSSSTTKASLPAVGEPSVATLPTQSYSNGTAVGESDPALSARPLDVAGGFRDAEQR